jgi:uncharacterized protein DUF5681
MKFRKGKSGNPKGRPRSAQNRDTIARKVMGQPVAVVQDGRRKKISLLEAVLTRHANKALTGDARSALILLNEIRSEKRTEPASPEAEHLDSDDQLVVQTLFERIRRNLVAGGSDDDGNEAS